MKFTVSREILLKPLSMIAGVVDRRQTLAVLSNALIELDGDRLSLTGSDGEVELKALMSLPEPGETGEITVPARKLADICRSLPDGARLDFSLDDQRMQLRCGRSRFNLSTLPASDYPNVEAPSASLSVSMTQGQLRRLLERTAFSMAQQDVRYYLNGMLFELSPHRLRTVATDGHRLAMATLDAAFTGVESELQVILPRKGVLELQRLLVDGDEPVRVELGGNHLHAETSEFRFTSKLVDGKFPDYNRVLPRGPNRTMLASRVELKDALSRTSILSNEKYRGVRMVLQQDSVQVLATNPEQEEAEEIVEVSYSGDRVEIGFNVSYLLEVLAVMAGEEVRMQLSDGSSSVLLDEPGQPDALYVVMPMRL